MSNIGSAYVDVRGDWTQFNQQTQTEGQAAAQTISQRLTGMGTTLSTTGATMTRRFTLPIVAAGTGILRTAGDFEQSMNQVRAVSGATGEEFDALQELAREMGATTAFSASDAADAMYFLSSAGFDTEQMLESLPAVLDLAAAGQLDLAQASDIASNILSGLGLEASELAAVNDVLVGTFQNSNTNVQQLGEAFSYVAPIAAALGIPIEEVAGGIGVLGDAGIQGSRAGRALAGAIQRLVNPTEAGAQAMDDLGVAVYDADGNMRPFNDIIGDLAESGASTSDIFDIFGEVAGRAVLSLIENSEGLDELTDELYNVEGAASEVAAVQMEGFSGQMAELRSALEGMALAIADSGLLEAATDIIGELADRIRRLADTDPEILRQIVGALIGLAVAGPLLRITGGAMKVMGALLAPKGLLIAGLALLAGGIGYAIWEITQGQEPLEGFRNWLRDLSDDAGWQSIVDGLDDVAASMTDLEPVISAAMEGAAVVVQTNVHLIITWLSSFASHASAVWMLATGDIKGFVAAAERTFEGWYTFMVGFLARLGIELPEDMGAVWEAVRLVIVGFTGRIEKAVQDIIDAIKSPFSGIRETFANLAASIPQGIRDGILSGLTGRFSVGGAASRLVGAAISAVRRGLRSSSPSLVFADIGRDITSGLVAGIDDGIPKVERAMSRMTAQATTSVHRVGSATRQISFGDINVGSRDDGNEMAWQVRRLAELYA